MNSWDLETLMVQYFTARKAKERDEFFELWTSLYPHMDKETFIPFDEFYNPNGAVKKTKEEIMREVDEIRKMAVK